MTSDAGDRARVRDLLGREPQGRYEIVVRDAMGDPVVVRNAAFLDDGTPMPTLYWLIDPVEIRRIGHLEAAGGVNAAEADVDPDELAAAHARYAAQRDAMIPADHVGPRPSGGVGGTRLGVKCLHAHWAWHLAGGDDPVGRWIAGHLDPDAAATDADTAASATEVFVSGDHTRLAGARDVEIPWGADDLTDRWLRDTDPPRPEALTNALGTITDHLDDVIREHPDLLSGDRLVFRGPTIDSLARVEIGGPDVPDTIELTRQAAEEIFRIVATEAACDRAHNPGLPSAHVETIVATCTIVLAFMRRLGLDHVSLQVRHPS